MIDIFKKEEKTISVYGADRPGAPVLYLNTFGEEGPQICDLLKQNDCPDFTLVTIHELRWDHDMVPWDTAPIMKSGTAYTGGADTYLRLLTEEILPAAEARLPQPVSWRAIAGYSLGGLFALYSLYQTDLFSRAASISGSLWFPGIREYIFTHPMIRRPERLYFSLGDREHKTGNRWLKTVKENTEAIAAFYQEQGIDTLFQLNPGNHFQDAARRTAAGIRWLLTPIE